MVILKDKITTIQVRSTLQNVAKLGCCHSINSATQHDSHAPLNTGGVPHAAHADLKQKLCSAEVVSALHCDGYEYD